MLGLAGALVEGGISAALLAHAELQSTLPSFLAIFLPRREARHTSQRKHSGRACQCWSCRDTRCSSGLILPWQVLQVCTRGVNVKKK